MIAATSSTRGHSACNGSKRLILALLAMLFGGCSQEPEHWISAEAANTESAYATYLSQHPNGENAAVAKSRLRTLGGDLAWASIGLTPAADELRTFLIDYPEHSAAPGARDTLAAMDWSSIAANPAADAYARFFQTHGLSRYAASAQILQQVYQRAAEMNADGVKFIGAEITGLGESDRGVAFHLDEKVDMGGVGMLAEDVALSSADALYFNEAELVIGNRVRVYLANVEQKLGQITLRFWRPLGFVKEP